MIDIEEQKKMFKDHVAKFTDYGNIKILDFQRPGSSTYRIRFLFQEDFYRIMKILVMISVIIPTILKKR